MHDRSQQSVWLRRSPQWVMAAMVAMRSKMEGREAEREEGS